MRARSAALDARLELARPPVDEHAADRRLDRAADEHAEHPARIAVEGVGRARAPVAQVLEVPRPLARLEGAPDLLPREAIGRLVAEAHLRLHGAHLDVVLGLDERRAAVAVGL